MDEIYDKLVKNRTAQAKEMDQGREDKKSRQYRKKDLGPKPEINAAALARQRDFNKRNKCTRNLSILKRPFSLYTGDSTRSKLET